MNAEGLLELPRGRVRRELIEGELREMAPAGHEHGRLAALLTASLIQHVLKNQLGAIYAAETGFKLGSNPDTVRAPDVAFVAQERLHEVTSGTGYLPGPPDLAIEIISPNARHGEVEEKVELWRPDGRDAESAGSYGNGLPESGQHQDDSGRGAARGR